MNNNTIKIDSFDGDYRWLSNFWPCVLSNPSYTCVEAAYQACKTTDPVLRGMFQFVSGGHAKRLGKTLEPRQGWDTYKMYAMETLLRQKFSDLNPELKQKLIDTGDAELIEGNWWGDTFWGVCRGVGENNLGKFLMKIRSELQ